MPIYCSLFTSNHSTRLWIFLTDYWFDFPSARCFTSVVVESARQFPNHYSWLPLSCPRQGAQCFCLQSKTIASMIFWMIYLFWASVRFLPISLTLISGIPFFCCDTLSGVFFFNRDRECLIIRFTTATESSFTGNPLTQKSVTWKTERPYFMRVLDAFCRLNCRLLSNSISVVSG